MLTQQIFWASVETTCGDRAPAMVAKRRGGSAAAASTAAKRGKNAPVFWVEARTFFFPRFKERDYQVF